MVYSVFYRVWPWEKITDDEDFASAFESKRQDCIYEYASNKRTVILYIIEIDKRLRRGGLIFDE